jgi:hypothetical protein
MLWTGAKMAAIVGPLLPGQFRTQCSGIEMLENDLIHSAMISHRNAVPHGWAAGERHRLTGGDRVLQTPPFSGTWGGLVSPLMAMAHGACLILAGEFQPLAAPSAFRRRAAGPGRGSRGRSAGGGRRGRGGVTAGGAGG